MTSPEGSTHGDAIVVGGDARQRFHDARGYGRPRADGTLALTRVEAAHLLARGDLKSIDGLGIAAFLGRHGDGDFAVRFLVYADLRGRGYYLWPTRWAEDTQPDTDFVVFERGAGPPGGAVAFHCRAVGERAPLPADSLRPSVLAVADEEGELTYFAIDAAPFDLGDRPAYGWQASATLIGDRLLVPDPPDPLYRRSFFGHPLWEDADGPIHLSLLEGAYLAERGALSLEGDAAAVRSRGRALEGERFDRRLRVYTYLRDGGLIPKTGFKFGADFRVYPPDATADNLGHSEALVRVLPRAHRHEPRAISHDVRLAQGVRKRMVFAHTGDNGETEIGWRSVRRITP